MLRYDVDLRDRKTGNSVRCILSTDDHDKAWTYAENWNKTNLLNYDKEMSDDYYIDGTEGLIADVYEVEEEEDDKLTYDVCVYGYVYIIEADNENEAKMIACDTYYEETGLTAYTDDESVVWKIHGEYPYEWK